MKKIAFSALATTALATMISVGDTEASSYSVKSGDSLWKIAAANGTTISQIKELNNLKSDTIFPRQSLLLASTGTTQTASAAPSKTQASSNTTTYTIKSGDTLGRIALDHKTTVTNIQKLNNISSHIIHPGQVITISGTAVAATKAPSAPAKTVTPVATATSTYVVKSGDTLGRIANLHNTTVTNIQQLNNITSHIIYPRQVLKVSGKASAAPVAVAPKPAPVASAKPGNSVYSIVSGDTLSGIAYRHRVTVDQIMSWNNLTSTALRIGQKLSIGGSGEVAPVAAPTPVPATPVAGSSLYQKVINVAKPLQGIPYVWGGSSTSGFDCSGYIYYVYKQAGLDVSRTNTTGFDARSYDISNPVPGDLVFFSNTYRPGISHMGIYIGNNQFIHAGGDRVQITSLSNSYWGGKFTGFKRLYAAD
ncbi:C40 family peptidase [Paenisporosarcina antarctica]|uniref:Peptidoglycan endopeptidase n=1 Tax=Paenisporosarcina antarctica TaxID=417367 RepID=A0A4P7A0U6_9BACL|nr:peptidoglycan endopeptidase [Paenisporosarcina antarctica]QBP42029.1 peptidoglycan endopeptidase [Paenisporosarcina antarctica]